MALSVVDLLEDFVAEHGRIGGPFESPEMFFKALEQFLRSPMAREAVAEAWWDKGIHHAHRSHVVHTAREAFDSINNDLAAALNLDHPPHGIRDEAHARRVIADQLHTVELATQGMRYEDFCHPGRAYVPAAVERAIAVIVQALSLLPPDVLGAWTPKDYRRLHVIGGRLSVIGKPVPLEDLWEVRTHIFPRLGETVAR